MKPATEAIRRAVEAIHDAQPLTVPIYETTTFVFDSAAQVVEYNEGKSGKYLYTRYGNPTLSVLEKKVAGLHGAEAALVFSSGQAATTTALLSMVAAGDEIVCSAAVYGGTLHLLTEVFAKLGVTTRFLRVDELSGLDSALSPKTKAVWFESPINPTARCVDIAAIARACRERGVTSIIDNTFASPINQQPLSLGVDVVMESATKYLNGHSDVTAGIVAGPSRAIGAMEKVRRRVGTILDPYAAYALLRGLKTLAVRVERHNSNASAIAQWLSNDRRVAEVYYPGLPQHPDHEIARRQMRGFGGMLCVDLGGDYERAARFFDRLKIIQRAASLGGVESLCSLPVLTSQWGHSEDELREAGVTRSMARLSIGLEDVDDLIADLDQALG